MEPQNNKKKHYRIFKDDGQLNLIHYCIETGSTPQEAIRNALDIVIDKKHHKGNWIAIPTDVLKNNNRLAINTKI